MRIKNAGACLSIPTVGLALMALAGLSVAETPDGATSHDDAHCCASCCGPSCSDVNGRDPVADAAARDAALKLIEAQTFFALPQEHQTIIAKRLMDMGEALPAFPTTSQQPNAALEGRDAPLTVKEFEKAWSAVEPWDICTEQEFARFRPVHQRMVEEMCNMSAEGHIFHVSPCFTPGTDPALVNAVSDITSFGRVNNPNPRFEQIGRWTSTALDPGNTGAQGGVTTLTYSFPADGTFIASGVGEGPGNNDLNAFLDGIYGNRATWRAIYDQIFARWGELSGITYILEPNDDGADLLFDENNPDGIDPNPGVAGVRGDLRMVGKAIDGNSGTLAYNFFPQFGDMVLDTADNFYNDTSNQSIRLTNILLHEHGHGMGQLHTCPIEERKLMEPFISVAFDGPQFDDILNAQRHYGDDFEPNDTTGQATPLGNFDNSTSVSVGAVGGGDLTDMISIDDDNDVDIYEFTVLENLELTATFTPQTEAYDAGPQDFFCSSAAPYNPLVFLNPVLELIDTNGVSVLETANVNPAGQAETIVRNLTPGTYYMRLTGTNANGDQIIAYTLDMDTDLPGFIGIDLTVAGGLPTQIMPGQTTTIDITVIENQDTLTGAPELSYREAGVGAFTTVPFSPTGADTFSATLPAFNCDEDPEIFVSVDGTIEGTQTVPEMGTQEVKVTSGSTVLVDDVETDIGWTVSGTAVEGIWERGVPQNNGRDDPPADFDGSGQAWLTGQEIGDINSDIDGGSTILTSPVFDYSGGGTISYAYWAQDSVNPIGPEDGFFVDYSINGGANWFRIRDYTTAGSWRTDTIDVSAEIGTPPILQIRFFAVDNDPGDVFECGVDAIEFVQNTCEDVMTSICTADFDMDGDVDLGDFGIFGAAFGSTPVDSNWDPRADFDMDGDVDLGDFGVFGGQFGNTPADCMP